MLRLIIIFFKIFYCLYFISKHLMLRLIDRENKDRDKRYRISKHLMLRLIVIQNINIPKAEIFQNILCYG